MRLLGVVALTVVACCIYVPTLHYEMIFDDFLSIVENESIHKLTPLFGPPGGHGPLNPQLRTPVSARPFVSLTLAINYHFSQADPMGYRLTHLVLHILTALILWSVLATTLGQPCFAERFVKYRHPLAVAATMLWMVHPAHNDTVVYLTQRTELLMGFFYILTVFLAIRFWACVSAAKPWYVRITWCLGVFIASACGMLSKEMMASVPAMVLVYEWTFVGGSVITILKRSWILHLALTLSWIPLAAVYALGYNTPLGGFNNTISAGDWWLTQSNSFFVYWRLLFKPWPLLLHYHVPTLTSFAEAWAGVLGMVAYAIATLYLLYRRTAIGFSLLWFFAALSPTLIVPLPHEEISERRLYVPLLAMLPYLSIATFTLIQNWYNRKPHNDSAISSDELKFKLQFLGHTPTAIAIVALVIVSIATVPRLSKRSIIWQEVLRLQPHNTFAIASQGCVEFNRGDTEAGIEKMQFAFDTDPGYHFFRFSLFNALKTTGKYDQLLDCCKRVCEYKPRDSTSVYNLAIAYEKNGLVDDAIREYQKSIELDPTNWETHSAVGTLLAEQNRIAEAIKHFEKATELKPDFINCMNLMGLYVNTRQNKKAIHVTEMLLNAAHAEKKSPELIERLETGLQQLKSQQQSRNNRL